MADGHSGKLFLFLIKLLFQPWFVLKGKHIKNAKNSMALLHLRGRPLPIPIIPPAWLSTMGAPWLLAATTKMATRK